MTIFLRGACALLLAAAFGGVTTAETKDGALASAEQPVEALFGGAELQADAIQQAGYMGGACGMGGECGVPACGDCGPVCDLGLGGGPGGQVFVGAEWLHVRANFSEATAYRVLDTNNGQERFEQFDFDYGDSYRLYGGYRNCCGDEIRFTYTSFDSGGNIPPAANDPTNGVFVTPPFEVALGDGDTIVGTADVEVDNYDIGFSRSIPLGGCVGGSDCCDPCGGCCDPCGSFCPLWDITWGGGIRIANVNSTLSYQSIRTPTNTAPPAFGQSTVNFDGVGLRFGGGARRYIGRSAPISVYVKGDISLLLGDVEYGVQTQPALPPVSLTSTEVIPVTEIEAGLTGYLTRNVSVTVGYLLSAWHDLGHRAEYDFSATGSQIVSMDDANLMTFDGLFLRAEAAF